MRKLLNASYTNTDLLHKHHMCNTRNILHIIDGANIISYGTIMDSKKGWFGTAFNINSLWNSSEHLTAVFPVGSERIGVAYQNSSTNTLTIWDFRSSSSGIMTLYFNNIYFPRPIYVRRVRVITTGITTTSGIGRIDLFDEKGVDFYAQQYTFKVLAANSPQYVFDFDFSSLKLQGLQPRCSMDTQSTGFVRFIIYYDVAE